MRSGVFISPACCSALSFSCIIKQRSKQYRCANRRLASATAREVIPPQFLLKGESELVCARLLWLHILLRNPFARRRRPGSRASLNEGRANGQRQKNLK
jgi:hypothetical protein